MIQLDRFCGKDEFRPKLHLPFSKGDWTYASDGRIAVRVPRWPTVPERAEAPNAEELFAKDVTDEFRPLPAITIPLPKEPEDCEECDGRGVKHECPTCGCTCRACSGSGQRPVGDRVSVGIGPSVFPARYILLLQSLPSVQITTPDNRNIPARFRFDGGEGLLIQIHGKSDVHVDAENPAPAPL
jgi:hypothetical protein